MSRSVQLPPSRIAVLPPLPLLREPDVSGLALWSALLMAGSVLCAFLSNGPAQALGAAEELEPVALTATQPAPGSGR